MTFSLPRIILGLDSQQFRSNFYICHVHALHLYSPSLSLYLSISIFFLILQQESPNNGPVIWIELKHYFPYLSTGELRHRVAI